MASARQERLKQELRQEILDAARNLFVAEGYGSVSMRKVAAKVGCAPGTIYLYFEDKDAILGAICQETFEKLSKRMNAIVNDSGDPLERLQRGGRSYVQFALDHPDHYIVTFGTPRTMMAVSDEVHQVGYQCFDCLRKGVQQCVDAGVTRTTDVEEIAQCLWASMHGLVMLLIGKPGFPFIEQSRLIERLLEITIEGIRKK